jgi:nucleoside-diphosphate-sugar epimerase
MSHKLQESNVALVTGATGYIGSNLVRRLVSDDWCVHIIVRSGSNLEVLNSILDRLVVHEHDGTTKNMIDLVSEANPDIIFHLASLFIAQHKPEDIEALITSNILFSTQIAEAAAVNRVKKFINTSTSWQHFQDSDYLPVNLYASTKQAFEDILQYYVDSYGLKSLSLVLFDTYGPDDFRPKLVSLLINSVKSQQVLEMSPGMQMIDIVYIDDVVDAFLKASSYLDIVEVSYSRYAVSSASPISLLDFVSLFESALNVKLKVSWGAKPYRVREVMRTWHEYDLLPNWVPQVSLYKGLKKLADSL